nr:MAG TPA: hypothetical protein [Caudoviricetes sp.]
MPNLGIPKQSANKSCETPHTASCTQARNIRPPIAGQGMIQVLCGQGLHLA